MQSTARPHAHRRNSVLEVLQGKLEPKAAAAQQERLQELRDSMVDNKTSEKARKYAIKYHKVCHHPAFPRDAGTPAVGCGVGCGLLGVGGKNPREAEREGEKRQEEKMRQREGSLCLLVSR